MNAVESDWWRGGVIYQVYPRSFADSNGDGIGDLPGITSRLDHIARLGADAVWLSPIFKSPMKDFGYDISDYNDIEPMFGTLADFDALTARAHELGLRVMIDQVLSHSSDRHAWFIESRSSRDNPMADWYVWADAKIDGNPPNNWLSVFGGSAWQWDTRRRQYYLHNFLASQPDVNLHHPQAQQALIDSVKFWLDRGVDGLRLDAINFAFHDPQLRDNPGRGQPVIEDPSAPSANPYSWQLHDHDKSQPEVLGLLQRLRQLTDQYPGRTMVGEIGDERGVQMVAQYTEGGDKLHMAYCFDLLGHSFDAPFLHALIEKFEATVADGWPCWALSNHDVERVATRWGGSEPHPALLRLLPALQLSLRGSVCLYQGEELGLPEAVVAFEDLQDPYGITMWPDFKGRDGCRTPMPWVADAADYGFGNGVAQPWLPPAPTHRALAADVQWADEHSLLHHYRRLLHWRRSEPALVAGTLQLLPMHAQVLAWVREFEGRRVLCAFNLSDLPAVLALPPHVVPAAALEASGATGAQAGHDGIRFEPYGVLFATLG